jgi:hypothetical protein
MFQRASQQPTDREPPLVARFSAVVCASHSSCLRIRAYPRETQEMVFDAHAQAFALFGSVTRRGIYDNMKTAVEAVFAGKTRRFNRRFEQMCSHYLIEPVACTPASGREKGQVENQNGYAHDNTFKPRPRFRTLEELNGWLEADSQALALRHPPITDAERCGKDEVINRIEQAIEAVPGYGAHRAHLAATVGYEESWGAGRFTLADGVSYEDLIDVLLGRARSVQLSDIEIRDTRFGTVGPRITQEGAAKFSVDAQPSDHCVVAISAPKRGEALTLDGEVYTLGAKNVADEFQRFRIQADTLELIVKKRGDTSAHGTIPVHRPLPIDRIERLAGLKAVLGAGEVEVEIFKNDHSMTGSITMEPDRHNYFWRRLHKVAGQLTDFLPPNRWPKDADLSAIEWFEAIEEGWKFASFVAEPGNTLNFRSPKPGFRALWEAADTYVGGVFIDLAKLTLFAMVKAPVERIEGDDARLDVTLGQPLVVKRMAFRGSHEAHIESMQTAKEEAHKRFSGPTTILASVMRMPTSLGADELSEDLIDED